MMNVGACGRRSIRPRQPSWIAGPRPAMTENEKSATPPQAAF
jgi:hypothetical protein